MITNIFFQCAAFFDFGDVALYYAQVLVLLLLRYASLHARVTTLLLVLSLLLLRWCSYMDHCNDRSFVPTARCRILALAHDRRVTFNTSVIARPAVQLCL